MKWGALLGITFIISCVVFFQWPLLTKKYQKRERTAFIIISILGWLLAMMLLYFPNTPGPTQFVDMLFRPLGKLLE